MQIPDQSSSDSVLGSLKAPLLLGFPVWGALVFALAVQLLPAGQVPSALLMIFALFAPLIGGLPIFQSSLASHFAALIFIAYYCIGLLAVVIVWVQVLN